MRLIDADAFIEYVNRRFDLCSDELRIMIEEQPTAYDVDAVEAELEDKSSNYKKSYKSNGKKTYKTIKAISKNKAIDIVRKGGIK